MEELMPATETLEYRQGEGMSTPESSHDKRWWILAVLGVAQLMVILDTTIVNIALPTAQHALHFSNADRQWIVTAYSLAFGSLLLLGGRIGDIIGRKRALLISLIGFAVASAIGGASTSFIMLVGARTIQGAFGALLAPSVLALLTTTFSDPSERGKAFGIYGAIAGAGGGLGLLLGGVLTSYVSWRYTLFVNLIFAVMATVGALLWLKNDKATDHDPLDFPGLFMVTGGLFSLVYGFSHADTTAWSNHYTISFLILGVVLLAAFAWFENRATFPLLPMRIVLSRTRGGSMLAMLFASIGIFGVFLFLTYYLQSTLGWSPVKTGLGFLPMVGALALTAQVSNRMLLPRVGPKPIIPVGLLAAAVALYELHNVGLHTAYVSHVFPYLVVLGVGFGLSLAPAFSTGTLGLAPHDAGVGSAALNTSQQVGGSIGTALLNTLAASATAAYLVGRPVTSASAKVAALHGYTTAFLWAALIFVIAAVATTFVLKKGNLATLAGGNRELPTDAGAEGAHSSATSQTEGAIMNIGIIGAGNIGGTLARRFVALGHHVAVANSRDPETIMSLAAEWGATAAWASEAVHGADVVVVTIPEKDVPGLPDNFLNGAADDVVVIDTGNYSKERDGHIDEIELGMTDSRWVEEQLGVSVVKAFNNIRAEHLLEFGKPQGTTGRIALPVAGDDADAKTLVMDLVDSLGFDPVDGGGLDDSWRQQHGNPAYAADFGADELRKALAEATLDGLAQSRM
jgi:EmrB/QacA subfamily drug resistance transporter